MSYFEQKSDRLLYRKLKESDIAAWSTFFVDNPNLPYLGMMNVLEQKPSNIELSKVWVEKQFIRYEESGLGLLAVELKSTGELIGQTGILKKEVEGKICFEIAYSLKPSHWLKGYATEMSKTMVDYAFHHKISKDLISIIHVDNIGSKKVAEKNSMRPLREGFYAEMPVIIYGLSFPAFD